jgi:hypothetical protein
MCQCKNLGKKSSAKSISYVRYGIFRYEPFKIKAAAEASSETKLSEDCGKLGRKESREKNYALILGIAA